MQYMYIHIYKYIKDMYMYEIDINKKQNVQSFKVARIHAMRNRIRRLCQNRSRYFVDSWGCQN